MSIEEALALGRRMMACKGFEWRAEMAALWLGASERAWFAVGCVDEEGLLPLAGAASAIRGRASEWVPNPRDPGVVGHALAMMRTLADGVGTGIPHCVPNPQSRYDLKTRPPWGVMSCGTPLGVGDSEVEAIVAAWEALS